MTLAAPWEGVLPLEGHRGLSAHRGAESCGERHGRRVAHGLHGLQPDFPGERVPALPGLQAAPGGRRGLGAQLCLRLCPDVSLTLSGSVIPPASVAGSPPLGCQLPAPAGTSPGSEGVSVTVSQGWRPTPWEPGRLCGAETEEGPGSLPGRVCRLPGPGTAPVGAPGSRARVRLPGLLEGEGLGALLRHRLPCASAGVRTSAGVAGTTLKAPEPSLSASWADPGGPSTRGGRPRG